MASNTTSIIHRVARQFHENKNSETAALRHLAAWVDRRKEHDPHEPDDYFSLAARKAEKPKPRVGKPVSGKGRNIYEDGAPAMSAGGAGDPGQVQSPTVNYAAQRVKRQLMRRKKPKT